MTKTQSKQKANNNAKIVVVITVIFIILMFLGIHLLNKEEEKSTKIKACLKPLAEKICQERGLVYSSININFAEVRCKESIRDIDFERFRLTQEEVEECR